MPANPQDTSYQDRLVALKLLRENMFYADPKKYALTDIAEDLPGTARAVGPILKNVLPSAAIISRDPAERAQQIDSAIARIKETKKSNGNILGEMGHNVAHLTPEAVSAGALFSVVAALSGARAPWKRNAAGKLRFQMPLAPISAIKKLLSSKAHALPSAHAPGTAFRDLSRGRHISHLKQTGKDILHGGLMSGAYTAAAGAAVPLIAGNYELSDNALQEAKDIMQKNPYLTSLPVSEMMSAIRQHKSDTPISDQQRVKNTLLGTGLGALTSLPGAAIPALLSGLGRFSGNALGRIASKIPSGSSAKINRLLRRHSNTASLGQGVGSTIMGQLKKDVPMALALGSGLGAISGAASSNNPIVDEYENLGPH